MNIVMIDNNYSFCDGLSKYLKSNGDIKVLKYFNNNSDALKYIVENSISLVHNLVMKGILSFVNLK